VSIREVHGGAGRSTDRTTRALVAVVQALNDNLSGLPIATSLGVLELAKLALVEQEASGE